MMSLSWKETSEVRGNFWSIIMRYSDSWQLYVLLRMPQLRKTSSISSNPLAAGSWNHLNYHILASSLGERFVMQLWFYMYIILKSVFAMSAEDFDTPLKMVKMWKALLVLISVPVPILSSFSSGYAWHAHISVCPALNLSHEIFPLFCVLFVLHSSVDTGFFFFWKCFGDFFYMTYFTKVCKWTLCSTEYVPHIFFLKIFWVTFLHDIFYKSLQMYTLCSTEYVPYMHCPDS